MLDNLIKLPLKHRLFVIAATAFIIVYGALAINSLPIDVLPNITKPTVTILTEAHGMAPEEVETRVTAPIEIFLNGLPGLERIRSQSGIGMSAIYLEFEWKTDIYRNRQLVQEKLNLAKARLPKDINPVMGPIGSLIGQIQQIVVTSEKDIDPMQLRSLAEWVIRPRLMMISGVSQVINIGGGLKQYQIQLSAEKINRYQLSLEKINAELAQISQNTAGGFLEKEGQELLVRNIGVVDDIEDIKNTFVGLHFGKPILVKDIASVVEAPRLKRGDGSFNGKPSVVMSIQKQPDSDTVKITEQVEVAINELKSSLPEGIIINTDVFKQANFIQASINGIKSKLKLGTVLVFIILFLFLANLRMSAITLTAIPLSFFITAIIFKMFGLSVNTMTLGGLAIAIGELVDDSIVDAENVFRRLRENSLLAQPRSYLKVIFEASSEVRNSIVIATLIIVMVFFPLFNLTGLEGRLFAPLGIAYISALLASLLVSLTLTPVMCSYLLKNKLHEHKDTRLTTFMKSLDRKVLDWTLPRSKLVLTISVVLSVLSTSLLFFMGRDFLPKFNEGTAMIAIVAAPGVSLSASNKIGLEAEKIILETKEIKSTSRRTGRAELDEHAMGVNVSEIDIDFNPSSRDHEDILNEIRNNLKSRIPNIGVNVGQPISHLIDHMLSGVSAAIAIKIFGPDLTTLREKSLELKNIINDTAGLVDLRVEQQGLIPQLKIHVLREEAAKYGLSAGEITHILESAFNGISVAEILEDSRIFEVFYQFDQNSRANIEQMEKTVLKIMPNGQSILVSDVADVYETTGPNEINRENGLRRMVISANVSKRDLGSLMNEIQKRVSEQLKLPEGYYVTYGGQFENQQRATKKIIIFGIIALIGIAMLLYSHFKSTSIAMQIMATIPLAFIGGILFLFVTGSSLTVAGMVGFITLCGMASRNAIMMITHYLHLMKHEGEGFTKEMIIRGSQERLIPVLMTASVAALALLPLVFAKGQPGSEILNPVALVIVGGLISSTLLDIIVTPTLFYKFGRKSAEKYATQNHLEDEL